MPPTVSNVDPRELEKFSALAARWWDPTSEFKPLHDINPLRLNYIEQLAGDLSGLRVLDVGCGGGLLSEGLAYKGAKVTGIDLAEKALQVAKLHCLESNLTIDYRYISAEGLAMDPTAIFDLVCCLEMLEHVPNPSQVVAACGQLVKKNGLVIFSTINRNFQAYLQAILGAEYILKLLPRGTHDYMKFIKPSELSAWARANNLDPVHLKGMTYNPFTKLYKLTADVGVNYLMACQKL